MILTCNSCGKKFVVPDSAITASGRMVQCGSCGNKWKQFPVRRRIKLNQLLVQQKVVSRPSTSFNKKYKNRKSKKRTAPKKPREISLYSPEYLAKKHGIKIKDNKLKKKVKMKKEEFLLDFIIH